MDRSAHEAAGLLLGRKLEDFREALESAAESLGGEDGGGDSLVRGVPWTSVQVMLRAHSRKALKDYIELLCLFGTLESGDGTEELYELHADRMMELLLKRVGGEGRADRNRALNLVAAVKAEARQTLLEETSRWKQRARRAESNESPGAGELDDRLPLARRRVFDHDLSEAAKSAGRDHQPLSLVMMDIDHFKKVNDSWGHPVGDEVLVEVATLVVERLAHKGRAYRYGGEEISLLLPTYSAEEAAGLAERIRKDLEARTLSSRKLRVTASFGVASIPDQSRDAKALLERADAALYEAKEGGRNRVTIGISPSPD